MGLIERCKTGIYSSMGLRSVFRAIALILLFLGMTVQSVSHATAQKFTFSVIDVKGNLRIEDSTIRSYADISAGKKVSAAQLNGAYQAIVASGLFEEVELIPKGSLLLIRVKEYPTINQVAFEGNRAMKTYITSLEPQDPTSTQ